MTVSLRVPLERRKEEYRLRWKRSACDFTDYQGNVSLERVFAGSFVQAGRSNAIVFVAWRSAVNRVFLR
jgi:hypothetical protein